MLRNVEDRKIRVDANGSDRERDALCGPTSYFVRVHSKALSTVRRGAVVRAGNMAESSTPRSLVQPGNGERKPPDYYPSAVATGISGLPEHAYVTRLRRVPIARRSFPLCPPTVETLEAEPPRHVYRKLLPAVGHYLLCGIY
jgi:hypothetical protein